MGSQLDFLCHVVYRRLLEKSQSTERRGATRRARLQICSTKTISANSRRAARVRRVRGARLSGQRTDGPSTTGRYHPHTSLAGRHVRRTRQDRDTARSETRPTENIDVLSAAQRRAPNRKRLSPNVVAVCQQNHWKRCINLREMSGKGGPCSVN